MSNYNEDSLEVMNNNDGQSNRYLESINPAGLAVAQRAAKEVEAMVLMAKRFPRDEELALRKVVSACKRPKLADAATYEYPRGGQKVTGPSIRLAEVLAQSWGNIDFGWTELSREKASDGSEVSHCEAWAWDIEANTRRSIRFDVPLVRDTKANGKTKLTEERDKYEMCANQAGRRMRACILNIVPGDVTETALEECERTIKKNTRPIEERRANAITLFAKFGVTQENLEKYLGCKQAAWTANDMYRISKVLNSINDGMTVAADHFPELAKKEYITKTQAELIMKNYPQDKVSPILKERGIESVSKIPLDDLPDILKILDSKPVTFSKADEQELPFKLK